MSYIVEDPKKNITLTLDVSQIITTASSIASGATCAIQAKFVEWDEVETIVGIRPNTPNGRFEPQGIVITKPKDKVCLLEGVWKDWGDNGQSDGDITEFTEIEPDHWFLKRLKPRDVKRKYPLWHPYHHEDKSYF